MVMRDSFVGLFHLPPPGPEPRVLLDLGSNIGTTMAHFAHLYERCLVFGVELDAESVSLCKRNIEPWRDRCEVLHAAVAASDGTSGYERRAGNEWGFRIGSGSTLVRTLSLDSIVERFALDQIDYLKMDVEGAEAEILRAGGDWPERVRVLKVEVHTPYTVDEALGDLSTLGFACERDERHKACVVARRPATE
jgi:FkbM family methyltransferase